MLEAIMANDSFSSQSVPAKTDKGVATSSVVATHVGVNKVKIDTIALKRLIDTLRAKLRS
jgi:hypothetical protein